MAYSSHLLSFDEWLSRWPQGKQRDIRQSVASDTLAPQRVKFFVKREVLHADMTKARGIQMYFNLATQAHFAVQFAAMQKATVEALGALRGITVTVASGMNAGDLSEWMNRVHEDGVVCYYERDGKSWDATMSKIHADLRLWWYAMADQSLADFARSCLDVKGVGYFREGQLRYSVQGTVKSGHNDTTLGNSLVNAAIAYEMMSVLGLTGHILVAGDDCLVALKQRVAVEDLLRVEGELGINPVGWVFTDPTHVSFVSGMWWFAAGRFWFTPKPGRLVARLWWTVSPPSMRNLSRRRRGIALGLWGVVSSIPVLREWCVPDNADRAELIRSLYAGVHYPQLDLERQFCDRYGVAWDDMRRFENDVCDHRSQVGYMISPVLDAMMRIDLADPVERARS